MSGKTTKVQFKLEGSEGLCSTKLIAFLPGTHTLSTRDTQLGSRRIKSLKLKQIQISTRIKKHRSSVTFLAPFLSEFGDVYRHR